MSRIMDEIWEEGFIEGYIEGYQKGIVINIAERMLEGTPEGEEFSRKLFKIESLELLMENFGCAADKAMEYLDFSNSEKEFYVKLYRGNFLKTELTNSGQCS